MLPATKNTLAFAFNHVRNVHVGPICMASEQAVYNSEEGLIPLIHEQLNEAQRVRYLRCLRHQQDLSDWKQQAIQAGQLILKLGTKP